MYELRSSGIFRLVTFRFGGGGGLARQHVSTSHRQDDLIPSHVQ